ncbi:50S ribosomal protein L7ae-like protein [Clostridium carnis]
MIDRLVGKKVIGIKQSYRSLINDEGVVLYVAKDAENSLVKPVVELAIEKKIKVITIDTMKELGKLCGISVKCAATLMLE